MIKKLLYFYLFIIVLCPVLAQNNSNVDSDNDGVVDRIDQDDDNDGILDIIENNHKKENLLSWRNRINVESSFNSIVFRSGTSEWSNTINSVPFSELGFNTTYKVTFNVKGSKDAIVGFGIEENSVSFEDVDYGFLFANNTFKVFANGEVKTSKFFFKKKDTFKIIYENGKLNFFQNKTLIKSFNAGQNIDFYLDSSFRGSSNKNSGKGNSKNYKYSQSNRISIFSNFQISSAGNLDTDNDGIINSLDLDSDGDGCNDVLEAGYLDADKDGVLGDGVPLVDENGRVVGNDGYTDIENDYLDSSIKTCSDESEYGIYVNTTNLPMAIYGITAGDLTIPDLTSGNQNSEVFVNLGEDDGSSKTVFLNVKPSQTSAELNLRFIVNGQNISGIEVLTNESWLNLANEFYILEDGKISFVNKSPDSKPPFTVNLINGVQYNDTKPLTVNVTDNIDLNGATLEIISPTNANLVVQPSTTINGFVLDTPLTETGSYNFVIRIQGKSFKGHFLVAEKSQESGGSSF